MANSLRESGSILADGTAWLIYTIFFILPPWLVFIVPGFWSGFGRGSAAARPSGAVEPPAVGERRGRTAAKGRRYFEGFRSGWLLRAAGAEQAQHHPGGSPVIVLGRAAKGGAVVVEIDHADFPVFPDAHIDSASGLRSEEHTSELQSHSDLVCRLLLEKKKNEQILDRHHHP